MPPRRTEFARTAPIHEVHKRYLQLALGDRLDLMLKVIDDHMYRGIRQMETYLATESCSGRCP